MHQHATATPPDIRDLNARISPALAAIITKLLAKDPDDRYQSGAGLLADLNHLEELNREFEERGEMTLGRDDAHVDVFFADIPLVGREAELTKLKDAWEKTRSGHGSVVLVDGEAGMGKSRLLRELIDVAKPTARLFLTCKCSRENPMPLAPLRSVVESYLRAVCALPPQARQEAEAKLREAVGKEAAMLGRFSPSLASLVHGEASAESGAPDGQVQFYATIAEFFTSLARLQEPALLVIDDIQWLDNASQEILSLIAEKLDTIPLLIATTSRNDAASQSTLSRFTNFMAPVMSARLTVSPLKRADAARLIQEHLGASATLESDFVAHVHGLSGGNPFAIGEYMRALLDAGLLTPSWGIWKIDAEGIDSLDLSKDVIQLVLSRIDTLDEQVQDILTHAARLGSHFELTYLPEICQVEP